MKHFQLGEQFGKHVTHYDSDSFIQPIIQMDAEARVSLTVLEQDGVIGYHQVDTPQLLPVLEGEGLVCSGKNTVLIQKGMAVLWKKEEWHETKTVNGLTALVIECNKLTEEEVFLKRHGK